MLHSPAKHKELTIVTSSRAIKNSILRSSWPSKVQQLVIAQQSSAPSIDVQLLDR